MSEVEPARFGAVTKKQGKRDYNRDHDENGRHAQRWDECSDGKQLREHPSSLCEHRDPSGGTSADLDRITFRSVGQQDGDDAIAPNNKQTHRPDRIAAYMSLQFQYP